MTVQVETTHGKGRNSEHQLTAEASQELLQILVDNIQECAILTLDPGGHVTTWTPAAARLKG